MPSAALLYTQHFALIVAAERGSDTLEPRDELAGLYIASAEFDRLLRYWRDWSALERLIHSECGSLNPRLFYWFRLAEASGERLWRRSSFSSWRKKISADLERVLVSADELASCRGRGPGNAHVVLPEDVLLALVRLGGEIPIGEKLLGSGLDLAQLERQVEGGGL